MTISSDCETWLSLKLMGSVVSGSDRNSTRVENSSVPMTSETPSSASALRRTIRNLMTAEDQQRPGLNTRLSARLHPRINIVFMVFMVNLPSWSRCVTRVLRQE